MTKNRNYAALGKGRRRRCALSIEELKSRSDGVAPYCDLLLSPLPYLYPLRSK
jgi:hypothetical protein